MNATPAQEFRHSSFHGRIGVARVDITPPLGIYARNWGAAKHDVAESLHRQLTLTALTLTPLSGGEPLVLLDADLGWWRSLTTFRKFQSRLFEELSLEPSRFIFALSHTHAGPPLWETDEPLPGNDLLKSWMQDLFASAVAVIQKAQSSEFVGILDWHAGRCGLAANRDFPDPESEGDRIICGFHPDGTPDDTLVLGRITDSTGRTRATLVNYACHPTTLAWDNTAISPDYVGAMRDTIQEFTQAPALFLLGACGELAPRYQYVGDPAIADQHGRQLAMAALATLHDMEPPGQRLVYAGTVESGAALGVWKRENCATSEILDATQILVDLPLKDWPSAEELEQQRLACDDRTMEERHRRMRDIRLSLGDGASFPLPLSIWRIGDAVLVGSCCEPYSLFQRELRKRFADKTVLVMNLINGSIGYLPPADLYDQEVYQAWQTPFDRGSLETLIEAAAEAVVDVFED